MEKSFSKFKKFTLILILLPILLAIALKLQYDSALETPNSTVSEKVVFQIESGESVDEILTGLVENDLLNSKNLIFVKFYLKNNNLAEKLQAGTYDIPKNLNIKELINTLQNGKNQDIWVTIPEGLRKDQIATILSTEMVSNSSFSEEEFLRLTTDSEYISTLGLIEGVSDLEGFLFPDKYAFPLDIDADAAIKKMVNNFKARVGTQYTYEELIFASIVEREGYNSTDRPVIAGIIIKRNEEGWLLQTDATLLYPVKDWKHVITLEDKANDNPYNTYKKIGLPPTPICNPGLESIKAVQNPTATDYYYYIHDTEGNPHYGRTLEEHNSNVQRYLR